MQNLSGKSALVTGGVKGIGLGICRRLLEEGMRVYAMDVDEEASRFAADQLADVADGRWRFLPGDVRDADAVDGVVRQIEADGPSLHALVNNAGLARAKFDPVEELSLDHWQRVLDTNLSGPFLCTRSCLPLLRRGGGSIVNIASTRAFQSEKNGEAYAASKGGLVSLTHALAVSLGPAVRVNCICPGWIDVGDARPNPRRPIRKREAFERTHPAGRIGRPADIGALVAFLVSDDAGFITGQSYVCDGGMTRKMIYA